MIRKVLIPLDGSPLAHVIIPCIQPLLVPMGAEVLLVSNGKHTEIGLRQHYLAQVAAELCPLPVTTQLLDGAVAESISAAADQWGADLIAMSTHGRTGVARAMLGSVADRVLHLAQQPVFLARTGVRAPCALNQLLVPLDGSPLAETVLPYAYALAKHTGATLTLLLVLEEIDTGEWGEIVGNGPLAGSWKADITAAAQHYLDGVKARFADVACITRLIPGQAAEAILLAADEEKSDLLLMNTHGRAGYQRWRHGSVASQVLHEANVPLFLTHGSLLGLQK